MHRLTYAEAAQALQLTYEQVRRRALSGELEVAEPNGGKQTVTFRSVAALAARMQRNLPLPDVDSAVFDELREPMKRFHVLGIERMVFLRSLEADAREAETRGDLATAAVYWQIVAGLQEATYAWNARRQAWTLSIPGLPDAETLSPHDVPAVPASERAASE